jgi:hypothetical protein
MLGWRIVGSNRRDPSSCHTSASSPLRGMESGVAQLRLQCINHKLGEKAKEGRNFQLYFPRIRENRI